VAISVQEVGEDAALVSAVQAGDIEAFSELFRRHHQAVRRACARRMGNIIEADEIAQAAFVRALERIDRCGGDRRFGPWVQVIAQRLCIDALRASSRTTPHAEPVRAERAVAPNAPEDEVLRAERRADVREALSTLPERQRQVVIDRDVHERRPTEIAAALGVSVGAVDSLLLRARRRLAAAYNSAAGDLGGVSVASTASAVVVGGTATVLPAAVARIVGRIAGTVARLADRVVGEMAAVPATPGAGRTAIVSVAAAFAAVVPASGPAPDTAPLPAVAMPAVALPAVDRQPVTVVPAVPAAVSDRLGALPTVQLGSPVPAEPLTPVATAATPAAAPIVQGPLAGIPEAITETLETTKAVVDGVLGAVGLAR
jgi:RNA polymerase sigma-70 factor, ECF subfamily